MFYSFVHFDIKNYVLINITNNVRNKATKTFKLGKAICLININIYILSNTFVAILKDESIILYKIILLIIEIIDH